MSKIEWTDKTWNPVTGCDKVSQGCKNCYAEKMHKRLMHIAPDKYAKPFLGNVQIHPEELFKLDKFKKGEKIFVNSMSDLFHPDVHFDFIDEVYEAMMQRKDLIFQILTKRPDIMLQYHNKHSLGWIASGKCMDGEHIWVGVSCEDQKTADERIPLLLQVPAAVRFLSCEPLLSPIDLSLCITRPPDICPTCGFVGRGSFVGSGEEYEGTECPKCDSFTDRLPMIDWVIAGGESGHNARPMHPDWVRSLRDQCAGAQVPFFFKQWGEYAHDYKESIDSNAAQPRFEIEFKKVGKSKSGNFLDGVQHLNFPA